MTAAAKRALITKAARAWMEAQAKDPTNEEADLDLDGALSVLGVLRDEDAIDIVWSDAPETLMLCLDSGTLIEIDVDSGNYLRGEAA